MASRKWTVEQRQLQAGKIREWKPWNQSTGPTSLVGKAKVARNADKGGKWRKTRELITAINRSLREQRDLLANEAE